MDKQQRNDWSYKDTYSDVKSEPLTLENLKAAADMVQKKQEPPLHKGLSWFTRLMNRYGWHREYEVLIFDRSKFTSNLYLQKRPNFNFKESIDV